MARQPKRTTQLKPPPLKKPKLSGDSEFHPAAAEIPQPIIASVKAWARGEATEGQQIMAFNFITENLSAVYDLSYRPDRSHATAFMEGRRFVGLQLLKTIQLKLARKDDARRNNRSDTEQPG